MSSGAVPLTEGNFTALPPSICPVFQAGFAACPDFCPVGVLLQAVPPLRHFKPALSWCKIVDLLSQMELPPFSFSLQASMAHPVLSKWPRYSMESRQAVCTSIPGPLKKAMKI